MQERGPGLTDQAALPEERQRLVLDRLARDGRVLSAGLARELGVSEDTVRRDLRELAGAGRCKRVYGGALPLSPESGTAAEREARAPARKAALAREAARLVRPGQLVLLDAGSTNLAIARALPEGLGITVATNAPSVAAALVGRAGIELLVIGGRVDPRAGASVGARAMREVAAIRADLCFLGACAVEAGSGVAAFDHEEAALKAAMLAASGEAAVAATTEKLGAAAPYVVAPLSDLAHLVVEAEAPDALLGPIRARGVRVHVAAAAYPRRHNEG
jgi:DeoR/GlpR family transcriptional regulator of sugar metabolism